MNKLSVEDLDLKGKRVLMRVDFNVPLKGGKVVNDTRIRAALRTIKYVTNAGGRLILMSHLGRPKGRRVPELSLQPCVTVLNALLGKKTKFVDDCIGPAAEAAAETLDAGDILLLENLRYYNQETDNDPKFAAQLAHLGDLPAVARPSLVAGSVHVRVPPSPSAPTRPARNIHLDKVRRDRPDAQRHEIPCEVVELARHDHGKADHRADGQVEPPDDQQHRHADDHDPLDGKAEKDGAEVRPGQKIGARKAHHDAQRKDDAQQPHLAHPRQLAQRAGVAGGGHATGKAGLAHAASP